MMDEQLIDEVAQHGVIFNRQKYYLNGSTGGGGSGSGVIGSSQGKYETKDEAWQIIAMKLRTDVETCKKRWKYLRERYVSQRKQGDPPVYEHLSRPYLEKMKFLDQHIQPRKSYRNVPNFLTSPHSANSSNYGEYNMDSKSNGSMKGMHYAHYQDQHAMNALSSTAAAASALENGNSIVKTEADQVFRDFAAAVASQQLQQMSQTQSVASHHHQAAAVAAAAAMAASSQNYQEQFRENGTAAGGNNVGVHNGTGNAGLTSTSSSMKSPLSSPLATGTHGCNSATAGHTTPQQSASGQASTNQLSTHVYNDTNNDDLDSSTSSNFNMKKPRVQIPSQHASTPMNSNSAVGGGNSTHHTSASNSHFADDSDDESDDNSSLLQPLNDTHEHHYNSATASTSSMHRNSATNISNNNNQQQQQQQQQQGMFPANADFLFQLYQQLPQQHQQQQTQAHQALPQHQHASKFQMPQTSPQRSSEHLLGELVTTELLKMSKERRKNVQKRILEILFFDD